MDKLLAFLELNAPNFMPASSSANLNSLSIPGSADAGNGPTVGGAPGGGAPTASGGRHSALVVYTSAESNGADTSAATAGGVNSGGVGLADLTSGFGSDGSVDNMAWLLGPPDGAATDADFFGSGGVGFGGAGAGSAAPMGAFGGGRSADTSSSGGGSSGASGAFVEEPGSKGWREAAAVASRKNFAEARAPTVAAAAPGAPSSFAVSRPAGTSAAPSCPSPLFSPATSAVLLGVFTDLGLASGSTPTAPPHAPRPLSPLSLAPAPSPAPVPSPTVGLLQTLPPPLPLVCRSRSSSVGSSGSFGAAAAAWEVESSLFPGLVVRARSCARIKFLRFSQTFGVTFAHSNGPVADPSGDRARWIRAVGAVHVRARTPADY